MKRITTILSALALLSVTGNAFAQFAGGNLVVSLVDSGSAAPTSAATQVRLIAFSRQNGTPNVTPTGQFYDLPTALNGSNHRLTNSGSAFTEGQVRLSEDGRYLLVVGYDAAPGTASVLMTTSAAVNRVVGRIDWTLPPATAINTATALDNAYDANSIRGAASPDGNTFFLSGSGGTTLGGVAMATLGATSATLDYGGTTTKIVRNIDIFNGNLFISASTSFGPVFGVAQVTAGNTTELSGFPTTSGPSSYGFFFLDADTLYVADDRSNVNGGIQKWIRIGSAWQLAYTFNIPAAVGGGMVGARGLAGSPFFDEDEVEIEAQLYAITTDNRLVTVVDDNPGSQVTVVAAGTTGQVFRGVEVIKPTTVTVGGFVTLPGAVNIQIPVHVEFRPTDGSPIFTRTVTIAADGTYTVPDVPAGKGYTIHVKADNHLAMNHEINTFTLDDLDADVTLLPGDATGDNNVDVFDLDLLIQAFNSVNGDENWNNGVADFNHDDNVDVFDLDLLVQYFNAVGEE